jgi:hypothetical protein
MPSHAQLYFEPFRWALNKYDGLPFGMKRFIDRWPAFIHRLWAGSLSETASYVIAYRRSRVEIERREWAVAVALSPRHRPSSAR